MTISGISSVVIFSILTFILLEYRLQNWSTQRLADMPTAFVRILLSLMDLFFNIMELFIFWQDIYHGKPLANRRKNRNPGIEIQFPKVLDKKNTG